MYVPPQDAIPVGSVGSVPVDDWHIARNKQHENDCYGDESMGVATLFCTRLDSGSDGLEITGHLGEGTFGSVDCAHLFRDDLVDDSDREDLSLSDSLDYQSVVVKEIFRDDVAHDKIFKAVSLAEDVRHEHVARIQAYMLTRENRIAVISERGTSLYHRLHLQAPPTGVGAMTKPTTPLRHSVVIDWALQVASGMYSTVVLVWMLQNVGEMIFKSTRRSCIFHCAMCTSLKSSYHVSATPFF